MAGSRTDPMVAATVGALGDMGYAGTKIARMTGVAERTVYDLLGGERKYLQEPVTAALRKGIKERLQARSLDLSDRCLNQVEDTLQWTSARDAAVVYGILRDHERLDAGEPTLIAEHLNIHTMGNLDSLLDKFRQAAEIKQGRQQTEIDVTPVDK